MEHYNNSPILTKTKLPMDLSSSMSSFNSPREEVGLVWPQKFYSCSFCRREFRSAQALGGHMNVHRRDRAKLRQSYTSEEVPTTLSKLKTTEESTRKLNLVDGEVAMCKRYKKSGMPFLYCSSSREEIDLELRLGDPPAVK